MILKCTKFALRTTTKDSTAAWQINLAGDGCDDVDECTSTATPHNCHTDAFCTNNDGSFLCNCNPTYIGRSIFSMMTTNLVALNLNREYFPANQKMKLLLGDGTTACDKEKCDHASGNFYGPDLACKPMPINAECNPADACLTYICSDGYELNSASTTIRPDFKFRNFN